MASMLAERAHQHMLVREGARHGAPGRTGEIDRAGEASPNSSCIGGVMVRRDHLNGEL